MAEIRTYDTTLIHNVRRKETMDDVLDEARDAWFQKDMEIDDPIAWPYFRPRTPWIAR